VTTKHITLPPGGGTFTHNTPGTYTVTMGGGCSPVEGAFRVGDPVEFLLGTGENHGVITQTWPPSKARNRHERRAERHAR